MKLARIGSGWNRVSKKSGRQYIALWIDPALLKTVYPEDFKKICLFPNTFRQTSTDADFVVMVPMKEQL